MQLSSHPQYCYDQAIVYSHALLATSHCGELVALTAGAQGAAGGQLPQPGVLLAIIDLDEYFHSPSVSCLWPELLIDLIFCFAFSAL